ncbi:MAG: NAD(P)H-binding protein [Pseudomonadota bacterium]
MTSVEEPDKASKSLVRRVLLLGATGTIGRATAHALVDAGFKTVCVVRAMPVAGTFPADAETRVADVNDRASLLEAGFQGERFDAVISCLASRNGLPRDAWAIDHAANANVLWAATETGTPHFVILSAICVQRPLLAFQEAKLALEAELQQSELTYSIVRPTAFFKSLSGQLERLRAGKPFLLFGNGELTACKPISNEDLAGYLVACLSDPALQNRVLPIGGPGKALTPKEQGELLFSALGKEPRYAHVPVGLMDAIIGVLSTFGWVVPSLKDKAELARIGRYYATESMLVWDEALARYDADATPSFGQDTLADHYRKLVNGEVGDERGEHKVF